LTFWGGGLKAGEFKERGTNLGGTEAWGIWTLPDHK